MSDLEQLRRLSGEVRPPAFDSLELVAGRRDRRARVFVALALVVAAAAVVATGLPMATSGDQGPEPAPSVPSPTATSTETDPTKDSRENPREEPTPASATSMTPKEVVLADDATLVMSGVSADDPDFRVSAWMARCHWCPESEIGDPVYWALAITKDGYATATYRRTPYEHFLEHVESPGPGLLLIVDADNGYEWLVRDDGTITELSRDFTQVPPADPRLWFVCLANTGHSDAGGAEPVDAQRTWCVLDPNAETVHIWVGPWQQTDFATGIRPSVVSPEPGELVWGLQDQIDDRLIAWWLVDGTRRYHDLGPSTGNGAVLDSPPGTMSYWSYLEGSHTLKMLTSDDEGSTWRSTDLYVAFRPHDGYFGLTYTPGGDLVGRQDDAFYPLSSRHVTEGVRLWRADFVPGGRFEPVYEARTGNHIAIEDPAFTILDDRIWASRLWSDDDGQTWTEEAIWR